MTNDPAGLLVVFAYVGVVVASVPVSVAALVLARWTRSFARALSYVLAGVFGLFLVGVVALAVLVDPVGPLRLLGVGVGALVALAAVPLAVGRAVVRRFADPDPDLDLDPDAALRWATAGWPVALVVSLVVPVAPGGPARYNVTLLSGPAAVVAWTVLVGVVLLGPGLVGVWIARAFGGTGD